MSKKNKQQIKAKRYYGVVVPGRRKPKDNAEEVMLSIDDVEYLLEDAGCNVDPASFIDQHVEVVGTIQKEGGKRVLSITSIREIPQPDDLDGYDDSSDYDYM